MQVAAHTGQAVMGVEFDFVWEDGRVQHIYGYACPLFNGNGSVRGSLGAFVDLSDKKEAELRVTALNERLRHAMTKTHHRVKNNLQVIAALLDLQTLDRPETLPLAEFVRLGHHVRTLAVIHDLLTVEAKNGSEAEFLHTKDVFTKMMPLLEGMIRPGRTLQTQVEEACLTNRQIASLAIVVNELVSNAIKHGAGQVVVSLTVQGGNARLEVCDDGPGFPSDFDPQQAANTGLELIQNLTSWDLQGEVTFQNRSEGGARVVVTITLPPA